MPARMRFIKKLDIYIIKGFLLLFAGTFFICLFIFVMQFLWMWMNNLIGKGLTVDLLAKFFWYSSLTLIPRSVPLAVLDKDPADRAYHDLRPDLVRACDGGAPGRLLQRG